MTPPLRVLRIAVLLIAHAIPTAAEYPVDEPLRADVDATNTNSTIPGERFGTLTPIPRLGATDLTVMFSSETQIVALLPPAEPATYRLVVAAVYHRGAGAALTNVLVPSAPFEVTIGAVGSAGPQRPEGPEGPAGGQLAAGDTLEPMEHVDIAPGSALPNRAASFGVALIRR